MSSSAPPYRDRVIEQVRGVPEEYLPALLRVVEAFRESVATPSAEDSFRQGWEEAARGEARPVDELWDGIDAE